VQPGILNYTERQDHSQYPGMQTIESKAKGRVLEQKRQEVEATLGGVDLDSKLGRGNIGMCWEIVLSPTFLHRLFVLPERLRKKFPHVIGLLKDNPHNGYSCKIRGEENLYRIYLTKDYRVLYGYGPKSRQVELYTILKRDEGTYKNIKIPDREPNEEVLYPEEPREPLDDVNSQFISEEQLSQWQIPSRYHDPLLQAHDQDSLLEVEIPSHLLERVIEKLYPKSLEEVQSGPFYRLPEDCNIDEIENLDTLLLNLSEQQQEYLDLEDNNAPILIKGGPGTGKSLLVIYRAKKYWDSGERPILITTYTEELVAYTKELLCRLLNRTDLEGQKLHVLTVDELATKYFRDRYGEPVLADVGISQYCLRQALAIASTFIDRRTYRAILKLGEKYLLEEIRLVIESRGIDNLEEYRSEQRYGRQHGLSRNQRQAVWTVYKNWSKILSDSGYCSIEQVRQKALEIAKELNPKPYKRILIDEAQEFSPVMLKFLAQLVPSPNNIYLTADVQQSLYQRSFGWQYLRAVFNFNIVEKTIRKSFRNTTQIGKACPEILSVPGMPREVDGLVLQFSGVEGRVPEMFLTDDPDQQIERVMKFFQMNSREYRLPAHSGVILSPDPNIGKFVSNYLTFKGVRSKYVETRNKGHEQSSGMTVMSLEASKGLEFSFVAIIGLEKDIFPAISDELPTGEKRELIKQQRQLFYVGCSRAMRSLLVCGSRTNPSEFITDLINNSLWQIS